MTDLATLVANLRRPRLLIQAARHGLPEYSRKRDLSRLARLDGTPTPEAALTRLIAEEEALEETRRAGEVSYSLARHIDLLIAILAEARLLPRKAVP